MTSPDASPEYIFSFVTRDLTFHEVDLHAQASIAFREARGMEGWRLMFILLRERLEDVKDRERLAKVPWGEFQNVLAQFQKTLEIGDNLRKMSQQLDEKSKPEAAPEVTETVSENSTPELPKLISLRLCPHGVPIEGNCRQCTDD